MRRLHSSLLLVLFLLIFFVVGCSKAPDATEPKKALNTYLEGLRDKDYEKLKETAGFEQLQSWPQDPKKLKELLAEVQDKSTGTFKSWTFEEKPFYDELNNQAIISTEVQTEKYLLVINFDLRRSGSQWRVYGSEIINETKIDEDSHR